MLKNFEVKEVTNITINNVVFPVELFNVETSTEMCNDLRHNELINLNSSMTGSKLKEVFPHNEVVASLEDDRLYELSYEKEYVK